MNKRIVRDLELALELSELRSLCLTEDELVGYLETFAANWELNDDECEYDN